MAEQVRIKRGPLTVVKGFGSEGSNWGPGKSTPNPPTPSSSLPRGENISHPSKRPAFKIGRSLVIGLIIRHDEIKSARVCIALLNNFRLINRGKLGPGNGKIGCRDYNLY